MCVSCFGFRAQSWADSAMRRLRQFQLLDWLSIVETGRYSPRYVFAVMDCRGLDVRLRGGYMVREAL